MDRTMKGAGISAADAEVLRWIGALGHRFAVVVDDGKGRRCLAETNTLSSAKANAVGATHVAIYEQVRPRAWREVSEKELSDAL